MQNRKIKTTSYALYQMFSFTALIFILVSFIMGVYDDVQDGFPALVNWSETTMSILKFQLSDALGVVSSTIFYIGVVIFSLSLLFAIYSAKAVIINVWDSVFLMFFFIPILGNIICLVAQLVSKEHEFKSGRIDRKEIESKIRKKINSKIKKKK